MRLTQVGLALAALLLPLSGAAQTTFSATDLDKNHDGKVELTKPRDSFKAKDTLVLCPDLPTYTYAIKCPAPVVPIKTVQGNNKNGVFTLSSYKGPVRVVGAYRAIESYKTTVANGVTIDGLIAEDLQRGGIRLQGKLSNIVISNSSFTFRSTPQVSPNLPACIEGGGNGATIDTLLVKNVTCDGFQMTLAADRYWNGDGPSFERGITNLMLDNVTSRNSTDSCFDIKPMVVATTITAEGCTRNIRLWTGMTADRVISKTPIKRGGTNSSAHIWVLGNKTKASVVTIGLLEVSSTTTAPVFRVEEGPAVINVTKCIFNLPAGTVVKMSESKQTVFNLGEGCTVN